MVYADGWLKWLSRGGGPHGHHQSSNDRRRWREGITKSAIPNRANMEDHHIADSRYHVHSEDVSECTFQPKINDRSRYLDRKRMKKIWEQHHNLQRPPSRQRTPFPTHLAEFEFKRFQAFGKDNAVKNKVPTDPIAKSQIMRARKVAEESPRPPSRHRPPGESLFLNESENRTKQQEDNNNNNKKNSKKKNTGEGSNKDNSTAGDKTKILYVDDLIMSSKQRSSSFPRTSPLHQRYLTAAS